MSGLHFLYSLVLVLTRILTKDNYWKNPIIVLFKPKILNHDERMIKTWWTMNLQWYTWNNYQYPNTSKIYLCHPLPSFKTWHAPSDPILFRRPRRCSRRPPNFHPRCHSPCTPSLRPRCLPGHVSSRRRLHHFHMFCSTSQVLNMGWV